MNWNIYSVMSKCIIAPGYSELWCEDKRNWIVIEVEDDITLKSKNQSYRLDCNSYGIGNEFSIINNSTKPVTIKFVIFRAAGIYNFSQLINTFYIFSKDSCSDFIKSFNQIFELNSLEPSVSRNIIYSFTKLFERVFEDNRNSKKALRSKIDPRLIWIHRKIRTDYYKQISLDELAESLQCNSVYLCNTYSKVFKCSPMKHLQNIRMKKAKELLCDTNYTIKEISSAVGYMSQSQFTTYFKKHVGVTPSEYRKSLNIS